MSDLRQQLQAVTDRIEKELKTKIRKAAVAIGEGLVQEATVDTGVFAANYKVGINEEVIDPSMYGIESDLSSYPHDRQISEQTALQVSTDIPHFDLGDTIFWSNATPYVEPAKNSIYNSFDPLGDLRAGVEVGVTKAKKEIKT